MMFPRIENFSTGIARNIKNNALQKPLSLVEKCINSTGTVECECISGYRDSPDPGQPRHGNNHCCRSRLRLPSDTLFPESCLVCARFLMWHSLSPLPWSLKLIYPLYLGTGSVQVIPVEFPQSKSSRSLFWSSAHNHQVGPASRKVFDLGMFMRLVGMGLDGTKRQWL